VFSPQLTNRICHLVDEYQKTHPRLKVQRKLMPGGACEATAFGAYGYEATCICLPLGNYHNMADIDGVQAGKRPVGVPPRDPPGSPVPRARATAQSLRQS
jgi:endoglucanase